MKALQPSRSLNDEPPRTADARGAFDAAWGAESAAVLGPIAREVGLGDIPLGALTLQLLYWLRGQHLLTRPEVLSAFAEWKGTGRNAMVTAADHAEGTALLDAMVAQDLVWLMGSPKRHVVSPKGIALLGRMNPSCEDLDLPWRLFCWERDWPASRVGMEGWVGGFFSRQRRFVPAS